LKTLHWRVFSASQIIYEARKGSREWVRHQRDPVNHPKPDRMRWVDYKRTRTKLPAGISKYQIPVLTNGGSRRRQARGRIARPQRAAADGGARTMLARRRGPLQRP
jgi:hypothetical protein